MAIDTYIQGVQLNPRFISITQGKNEPQWIAFAIGIFLPKAEFASGKNFKRDIAKGFRLPLNKSKVGRDQ